MILRECLALISPYANVVIHNRRIPTSGGIVYAGESYLLVKCQPELMDCTVDGLTTVDHRTIVILLDERLDDGEVNRGENPLR